MESCLYTLPRILELLPGESLEKLLDRALPKMKPMTRAVLAMRYGFEGTTPLSVCEVARRLERNANTVRQWASHGTKFLRQVLVCMRRESKLPWNVDLWAPRDFFTVERAMAARLVYPTMANRLQEVFSRQEQRFPTVGSIWRETELTVRRIPRMNTSRVRALKAMLATAHRELALPKPK